MTLLLLQVHHLPLSVLLPRQHQVGPEGGQLRVQVRGELRQDAADVRYGHHVQLQLSSHHALR